ncbi:MAG: tRNA (adenosine(37)-N6)-threonylcarbamoyltransferase complex ATPase subunit type 1 TsaE [Elusimicrobiota bacterium]|jgi:tRNA threonylcarbamoyladenosine biosynthesis protein TsaE|nr:tRNA (adenosine(37)-N6)-threonylcarbamoyltransferase complex ATPase subunit type 1 TsaE [Elusimicrobiota bacterium]
MKSLIFNSASPLDTQAFAALLAACLNGGEIIFFDGPIGAGKTVMVSGIAAAFGFKKRPTSASFSLMKKYKNKNRTIYHIDLFRLCGGEMFNLGFEEMLEDEAAIILAEWPKAAADFFPKDRLEITISLKKSNGRKITLKAKGPKTQEVLKCLKSKLTIKSKLAK